MKKLNNNAVIFYELLISITILLTIINSFLVIQIKLKKTIYENRLNYQMKQILYSNILLYEDNKELIYDEEIYKIIIDEQKLCIEWNGYDGDKKSFCESYYKT